MTPSPLPKTDCHHSLRQDILSSLSTVSFAWDWQFRGITQDGINKYSMRVYDIVLQNRQIQVESLALHETSNICLAYRLFCKGECPSKLSKDDIETIRGILPTLKRIVQFNQTTYNEAKQSEEIGILNKSNEEICVTRCGFCNYELSNRYMRVGLKDGRVFEFCLRCYCENAHQQPKKIKGKTKKSSSIMLCHYLILLETEQNIVTSFQRFVSEGNSPMST